MEPPDPAQIATERTSSLGLPVLNATCTVQDMESASVRSSKESKSLCDTNIELGLNVS